MCLGVPMQVLRCEGNRALCDDQGSEHWIDISLVGEQPEGGWLLTFLGAAREVLDAERAAQIRDALSAVSAVMAGESADFDQLFADLIEREPVLPDHLKS